MNNCSSLVVTLCERALSGHRLTRDEIVSLLSLSDVESLEILRQASEEALRRTVGEIVRPVFCLSISTFCDLNCTYCDYRSSNVNVPRFRLSVEDVIEVVTQIPAYSNSLLLLDGAQDSTIDLAYVSSLFSAFQKIKNLPELVFSFGERSRDYFNKMKELGMANYILEHKTTSPILYNTLHPEQSFYDRRQSINSLLYLDVNVGTSMMVGFPKQDVWDLADDFISILESGTKTLVIGPFIPGSFSPLADSPRGTIQSTLNAIAVARLMLKDAFIPTGLTFGILDSGSAVEALRWGANGVMLYLHPPEQSEDCSKATKLSIQPDFQYVSTRVCSLGRVMEEQG